MAMLFIITKHVTQSTDVIIIVFLEFLTTIEIYGTQDLALL